MHGARAMSETDLRPGGHRNAHSDFPPPPVSKRPWWDFLATKWAVLGILVVLGFTLGYFQGQRNFASPDRPKPAAERARQDPKQIAPQLISLLRELNGDDKQQIKRAQDLAADYRNSREREEREVWKSLSDFGRDEMQKRWADAERATRPEIDRLFEAPGPAPNPKIVSAIEHAIPTLAGEHAYFLIQRYIRRIEQQAKSAASAKDIFARLAEKLQALRCEPKNWKEHSEAGGLINAYYAALEESSAVQYWSGARNTQFFDDLSSQQIPERPKLLMEALGKTKRSDAQVALGRFCHPAGMFPLGR